MTAIGPRRKEPETGLLALGGSGPKGDGAPPAAMPKPLAQNAAIPKPAPAPTKRPVPARPPALVGTWKADGNICKHVGKKLNCWTAYTAYKDWADSRRQTPVDFSVFCLEVALHVTETPPKASSFFLDAEMPVKLKVVNS